MCLIASRRYSVLWGGAVSVLHPVLHLQAGSNADPDMSSPSLLLFFGEPECPFQMRALQQQSLDFRGRQRAAEQVALQFVTLRPAQEIGLLRILDAFGDDFETEAARHGDDGRRDAGIVGALRQSADEALVDLQHADREALDVRQRRIAGAEVVDRKMHAACAQPGQALDAPHVRVHQDALGQLQLELVGVDSRLVDDARHGADEIGAAHLRRRDIDRHSRHGCPAFLPRDELPACRPQHPFAERNHQATVLGHRDELAWRHQPVLGMLPAQQRLDADDRAVGGQDLRLIEEAELVPFDALAHVVFECQAPHRRRRQRSVVELPVVAAERLGVVHRRVGMLEQRRRVVAVAGKERDADARGHRHFLPADVEWLFEHRLQAGGDQADDLCILEMRQDDRELVAAEAGEVHAVPVERRAGDEVVAAQPLLQAIGHRLQQLVADAVSEGCH